MSTIHVGHGSIVVEWPDEAVQKSLSFFNSDKGEYEQLFTLNERHYSLVTLPGFAERIRQASDSPRIRDERIPLPEPDLVAACDGLEEVWRKPLTQAILAGGGVISVPDLLGTVRTMGVILKAFPQERLTERGTPLSIIAARDTESARNLGYAMRTFLPEREIGIGGDSDSDDIIVAPYRTLADTPRHLAGVFLGDDLPGEDFADRVEAVSGFRNAARFGIWSTPAGGPVSLPLAVEGLFGQVSATVAYDAAVRAELAVPVTVCWLPAPRPNGPLGSADLDHLEAYAHQENPAFVQLVAEIVRNTPKNLGCLLHAGTVALVKRVQKYVPILVDVNRHMTLKERRTVLTDIASGVIGQAAVTSDCLPHAVGPRVVIAATGRGANFPGRLFPWKKIDHSGEKAYLVDFLHTWDVHNGRPGLLKLNDAARAKRYQELGFRQLQVDAYSDLPFLG